MGQVRVCSFSVSVDGYGAGPAQALEHPLGIGGEALHNWVFATKTFRAMTGQTGGGLGVDDRMAAKGFERVGAWIIGRNMFGPERGEWSADPWRGWWGEEPPYHTPVFVLTRFPRPRLTLGGTVFHFVTEGIEAALARARAAAGDQDVRIGGGAETIRQYLGAGLIDEMHLALAPVLLGRGEPLWGGLDLAAAGYACRETIPGENAVHLIIEHTGTGR